jgi:type IV secretory pathway TrbD component
MDVTPPHPEDGGSGESKEDLASRRSRVVGGRLLIAWVVVVETLWIAALVGLLVWFVVR